MVNLYSSTHYTTQYTHHTRTHYTTQYTHRRRTNYITQCNVYVHTTPQKTHIVHVHTTPHDTHIADVHTTPHTPLTTQYTHHTRAHISVLLFRMFICSSVFVTCVHIRVIVHEHVIALVYMQYNTFTHTNKSNIIICNEQQDSADKTRLGWQNEELNIILMYMRGLLSFLALILFDKRLSMHICYHITSHNASV